MSKPKIYKYDDGRRFFRLRFKLFGMTIYISKAWRVK